MKVVLLASAVLLASCSEAAPRISVEVKSPSETDANAVVYRTNKVEVAVSPEVAAAVEAEIRKDTAEAEIPKDAAKR